MYLLFDEAGKFLAGKVLSEAESSLQVELDSGKRVKVKAANALLRFEKPAPAEFLAAHHHPGMLGALRNGSVVSPLFSAFGPEPIATRDRWLTQLRPGGRLLVEEIGYGVLGGVVAAIVMAVIVVVGALSFFPA